MIELLNIKENYKEIEKKRQEIYNLMMNSSGIKNGAIRSISEDDLERMFRFYDGRYFGDWFKEKYKGSIKFSLSRKMTRSAGKTMCPANIGRISQEDLVMEIRIGIDFFLHYGMIDGHKPVCGIKTKDSLHALQLVFEHELCHVLEFLYFNASNCKGKRFKTIAGNLFGHTESCHRLPTNRQIAQQKLGISVGDTVSFTYEGEKLTGFIYGINKRATVLVKNKNGNLTDRKGNRYSKYYVPLGLLT